MNKFGLVVFCVALMGIASAGSGYTFDQVVVEEWAYSSLGASDNAGMCVIDFGPGNNYAFGYKWNNGDTFTREGSVFADTFGYTVNADMAEVMMLTLNAGAALTVGYHYHDTLGFFLDSLSYDGYTMGTVGWPTDWLSYWNSADGEGWIVAPAGVSIRQLNDGEWDGWGNEVNDNWPPSKSPTTPIPEPATLCLLAAGGLALLRRRNRARA